eukprot:TRINITY_DN448_c2_g1_i1.p1 TRINITY_DN448_c2_g1~~TRINITY_DN448_c2_g1_i1.p1  ORF type:complete len:900 (+),score=188.05 TRINITY_DN448_c2_g1_i1:24-2702(+)
MEEGEEARRRQLQPHDVGDVQGDGGSESESESGSSVSGSDSSEEESWSYEEEEPRLKYQRLGANVTTILQRDRATAIRVHPRFIFLGTDIGIIYMLDFEGHQIKIFEGHEQMIRSISVDLKGENVASAALGGLVLIHSLYTKDTLKFSFPHLIDNVSIDPAFSSSKKEEFVCGGKQGKLIHNEKGFWFGTSEAVLHEGEGPIYAISWGENGDLIAWANDVGVKMYDTITKERITFIERPKGSPHPHLHRCCFSWADPVTLIIGWADTVTIAKVIDRPTPIKGRPNRYVEILRFQIDIYISGIAPYGEDLMILGVSDRLDDETGGHARPELRITTRNNEELSTEALSIQGYEKWTVTDYLLDFSSQDSLYYIVSPHDVVVAKPRDLDDRISWLLERAKYEDALMAATGHENELYKHNLTNIGGQYLEHLLREGKALTAAGLCGRILGKDAKLWEDWIFKFQQARQLQAIGPVIPVNDPTLDPIIYEMVLNNFLNTDSKGFLELVTLWPPTIYSLQTVINKVKVKSHTEKEDLDVQLALAKLYTYNEEYDHTLHIYLHLGRGNVFELIREKNLFDAVGNKVLDLMNFDSRRATELLITNVHRIPVKRVISQLEGHDELQLQYLHSLFYKGNRNKESNQAGREFHDLQVKLYATLDPTPLYDFLEKSTVWSPEAALEICREKNLWREMVFIHGRLDNVEQALTLMVDRVGDVHQAVEFVHKKNDPEVWDLLIAKSIRNPVFVSGLLENVGTHINPLSLVQKIPNGLEIIGLRDRLVKIISDYLLQKSLSEGCKEVLNADVINLSNRLYTSKTRGVRIDYRNRCGITETPILNAVKKRPIIQFFCGHSYYRADLINAIKRTHSQYQQVNGLAETPSKFYCVICRENNAKVVGKGKA